MSKRNIDKKKSKKNIRPTKRMPRSEEVEEIDDIEEIEELVDIEDDTDGNFDVNDEDSDIDAAPKKRVVHHSTEVETDVPKKNNLDIKTKEILKRKINEWLDSGDKIKETNTRIKKYKDAKKKQEAIILQMLSKLKMDDDKIEVKDTNDNVRSCVYRHKSTTRGALKEDTIKNALMEIIRDEKKVDQLVKKIESKRPVNEKYYLKRTKGVKPKITVKK